MSVRVSVWVSVSSFAICGLITRNAVAQLREAVEAAASGREPGGGASRPVSKIFFNTPPSYYAITSSRSIKF